MNGRFDRSAESSQNRPPASFSPRNHPQPSQGLRLRCFHRLRPRWMTCLSSLHQKPRFRSRVSQLAQRSARLRLAPSLAAASVDNRFDRSAGSLLKYHPSVLKQPHPFREPDTSFRLPASTNHASRPTFNDSEPETVQKGRAARPQEARRLRRTLAVRRREMSDRERRWATFLNSR